MSEVYNFVWSLDDLHEVLQDKGFALSWTATYCRLLPANARHKDGKSLVYTVPVKLLRPHNDLSKKHRDGYFTMAPLKFTKELTCLFVYQNVFFLFQDNKASDLHSFPVSKK